MAAFFRKLRQKLIPQTSTGKYLAYALGEILLVVIGILIALSIDNWNEKRQQNKRLENILITLKTDIRNDLEDSQRVLEYYNGYKDEFVALMNGTMTEQEFKECGQCAYLITGHSSFNIEVRGYEALKQLSGTHDEDTLVNEIVQFYTASINNIDANDELIGNSVAADLVDMRDNYDWFPDFIQGTDQTAYARYATSTQKFRNITAWRFALIYSNYVPAVESFEKKLNEILASIEARTKKE